MSRENFEFMSLRSSTQWFVVFTASYYMLVKYAKRAISKFVSRRTQYFLSVFAPSFFPEFRYVEMVHLQNVFTLPQPCQTLILHTIFRPIRFHLLTLFVVATSVPSNSFESYFVPSCFVSSCPSRLFLVQPLIIVEEIFSWIVN